MNKEELYNKALSNIHRYSLLNEIFAIRDERFPKEQQDSMLCVNGYIGIDTLNRYVRYIDELVEYQNIGTIKKFNKQKEVLDKIKEMTKDLFETEYEGIYKKDEDNCCEKFYLLEELNKLLEEIE